MKIKDIKVNPNNPRYVDEDRLQKLADSIQQFPEMMTLRPIVVNSGGIILGGNMRYRALRLLDMQEIPDDWVIKAESLTPEQQRRFIIEDNVAFGYWDWDILANEWDEDDLLAWGLEIPNYDPDKEDDEQGVPSDSITFCIKCDNKEQLTELQQKLDTAETRLSYENFIIKSGL